MTSGCTSPDRVCCTYPVTGGHERMKAILVSEALGL